MTEPVFRLISQDKALSAMAADLLRRPTALSDLRPEEARCVVSYMRMLRCNEGTVMIREGDQDDTSHMLLLMDGEVSVERMVISRTEPVVVTVLGPGSLIGEMGVLDGAPRAASCVALSSVLVAALSRGDLRRLMIDEPSVAAKLLVSVSSRLADRLREAGRQHRVFGQLVHAMQGEIDELNRQLQMVMDGASNRQPAMDDEAGSA